ncbi:MAG: hypothetical protein P4N59_24010, partial [Negativicutes bacterium]|nr:hypothetical protein [Negativicutes bacterium]
FLWQPFNGNSLVEGLGRWLLKKPFFQWFRTVPLYLIMPKLLRLTAGRRGQNPDQHPDEV